MDAEIQAIQRNDTWELVDPPANCQIVAFLHGEINEDVYLKQHQVVFFKDMNISDYVRDLDDRKSTSGYAFMLGGGVISWASKKQPVW
ncbi:hypothetical protein CR513_02548, partial [Mucuna pruriens]